EAAVRYGTGIEHHGASRVDDEVRTVGEIHLLELFSSEVEEFRIKSLDAAVLEYVESRRSGRLRPFLSHHGRKHQHAEHREQSDLSANGHNRLLDADATLRCGSRTYAVPSAVRERLRR